MQTSTSHPFTAKRTSSPLSQPPVQSQYPTPPPPPVSTLKSVSKYYKIHSDSNHPWEELRAKISVLEAKRADDSQNVHELESRLASTETKSNSLQTDLIATRREIADSQQLAHLAKTRVIDAQEQLEMVMLDKEAAEERAELAETELEDVLAVLEVDNDVLKEGSIELSLSFWINTNLWVAYRGQHCG